MSLWQDEVLPSAKTFSDALHHARAVDQHAEETAVENALVQCRFKVTVLFEPRTEWSQGLGMELEGT